MNDATRIILASTSPYRRKLFERLHVPFEVLKPDFDEASPGSMSPEALVGLPMIRLCKVIRPLERLTAPIG
ncbi:MAG: Maf family protein [Mariprofundaceae bacterium]